MKLLENKVALITGAGRGIGKAIAIRFAQEGCDIAFTDIALSDFVLETEKELQAIGVKARHTPPTPPTSLKPSRLSKRLSRTLVVSTSSSTTPASPRTPPSSA